MNPQGFGIQFFFLKLTIVFEIFENLLLDVWSQ
jgi:hypothetical protein